MFHLTVKTIKIIFATQILVDRYEKAVTVFSIVVISLFILSLFGYMVNQISSENKKFGFLTEPVKFMYSFPELFEQSVEEVKGLPKTFIPTPKNFEPINKLNKDILVLSTFSDTSNSRSLVVRNLKNDSILNKWTLSHGHVERSRIMHPLLFPDTSVIFAFYFKPSGLKRVSKEGKLIWKQDSVIIHHSMELNSDGDIWACSKDRVYWATGMYKLNERRVFYIDYPITKIDGETGEILFHKSISQILKDNNLENYILKSPVPKDPIHVNDVQPALKTTQFYRKDDVFISLRNLSCVIHYRPSTNKVIDIIEGPFISQHDVDFLNDNTLAIFNNNFYIRRSRETKKPPKDSATLVDLGDFYSNVVTYNLKNNSYSFIGDSLFKTNEIFTATEGLVEFIDSSTYFVEEQNSGLLWIIKDNEVVYKNVFKSQHKGHHHLPNWTRIINYD